MARKSRSVFLIINSVFLIFSLIIASFYVALIIQNNREEPIDLEYAMFKAEGSITTETYSIDIEENVLYFFKDIKGKRTLFSNAIPNLKIINDDNFFLEITTNQEVHNILDVYTHEDGYLVIDCNDEYYNRVHEDDGSYDYDFGLYVDCEVFDVILHAPISEFFTNTMLTLDFDVAQAESVYVYFSFEGVNGRIYNVNTEKFYLNCSGSSNLELSGRVKDTAEISIRHDTHVDATQLQAENYDNTVSRGIGGFSYIKHGQWYKQEVEIADGTNILAFFVWVPLFLWTTIEVVLIVKRSKMTR